MLYYLRRFDDVSRSGDENIGTDTEWKSFVEQRMWASQDFTN